MEKLKVLYVTQEMKPYLHLSEIADIVRQMPTYAQEAGMEVRVLMPRFGVINERRHRLHEVVRLSGINIIIDDDDYPLLIKVASLPGARMQVYFLDNDDFFKRKAVFGDKKDEFYEDNGDRMIFFCKGVIETVKKFGWAPDIIHCNGWMTSLIPFYLKTAYKGEPIFNNTKVVYSLYDEEFNHELPENFSKKAIQINKPISDKELGFYKEGTNNGLEKGAVSNTDGVMVSGHQINPEVQEFLKTIKKPVIEFKDEEMSMEKMRDFYLSLIEEK